MKLMRMSSVVAVVAVVGLAAGCGSDSGSTAAPGKSGDATATKVDGAPAPTKPAKDLVLTAAELPAGIEVVPVTNAQLQSAVSQFTDAASTMKSTPAECGSQTSVLDATSKIDVSKIGMVVGTSKTGFVASTVLAAKPDIAKLRKAYTGPCKTVSAEITTMGQNVSTRITTTVLEGPATKASELVVVKQSSASKAGGVDVHEESYQGFAQVGGYSVTVNVKAMTGAPDKAMFDEVLVSAIDKVAKG